MSALETRRRTAKQGKASYQILEIGELKMADLAQLEESIVGLSLLEAAELVKKLEARLGFRQRQRLP